MTGGTVAESLGQLLRRPIEAAADEVTVVSADPAVLREAVLTVSELGDDAPARARVYGPAAALDRVDDDFRTAARAADLVATGRLDLRAVDDSTPPSVVVTGDEALAPVPLPDGRAVGLRTDDGDAVEAIVAGFESAGAAGEPYRLAVPAYSRMLDALEAEVGRAVREEFAAALDAPVAVRGTGDALDEIDTALLLGARNRAQLYELSEWAEGVGLASRATVSARKRRLEAAGLLATEKVATDVGRPRQRLVLADESLAAVESDDLLRAARSVVVDGEGS